MLFIKYQCRICATIIYGSLKIKKQEIMLAHARTGDRLVLVLPESVTLCPCYLSVHPHEGSRKGKPSWSPLAIECECGAVSPVNTEQQSCCMYMWYLPSIYCFKCQLERFTDDHDSSESFVWMDCLNSFASTEYGWNRLHGHEL